MKAIAKETAYYDGYRVRRGDKFEVKPGKPVPKWAIEIGKDGKPVTPLDPEETEKKPPEPATFSELAAANIAKPPVKARPKTVLSE